MEKKTVKFTFTEVVYGVVIATAMTRINSLSLTQGSVLLIVARDSIGSCGN